MLTVARKEDEAIIVFADDPTTPLGKNKVEVWIKKIHLKNKDRVELAISAPKDVPITRGELITSCDTA